MQVHAQSVSLTLYFLLWHLKNERERKEILPLYNVSRKKLKWIVLVCCWCAQVCWGEGKISPFRRLVVSLRTTTFSNVLVVGLVGWLCVMLLKFLFAVNIKCLRNNENKSSAQFTCSHINRWRERGHHLAHTRRRSVFTGSRTGYLIMAFYSIEHTHFKIELMCVTEKERSA